MFRLSYSAFDYDTCYNDTEGDYSDCAGTLTIGTLDSINEQPSGRFQFAALCLRTERGTEPSGAVDGRDGSAICWHAPAEIQCVDLLARLSMGRGTGGVRKPATNTLNSGASEFILC